MCGSGACSSVIPVLVTGTHVWAGPAADEMGVRGRKLHSDQSRLADRWVPGTRPGMTVMGLGRVKTQSQNGRLARLIHQDASVTQTKSASGQERRDERSRSTRERLDAADGRFCPAHRAESASSTRRVAPGGWPGASDGSTVGMGYAFRRPVVPEARFQHGRIRSARRDDAAPPGE